MKKIKNIMNCVLGIQGVGAVKPGETVDMPDDIAASCLTSPDYWSEVKPERTSKKTRDTLATSLATIEIDVTLMEDKDHGSN